MSSLHFNLILLFILFLIKNIIGDPLINSPENSAVDVNTVSRIKNDGYPVEEHFVQTSDGYILALHRIPFSPNNSNGRDPTKLPILLQHGLLCSSSDWVLSGPQKALAYLLSDAGYDVWLGNARGNAYSKKHAWLDVKTKAFWNFSWHEIGLHDISAMIDHILNLTNYDNLHYVGHSQGTTAFYVLASLNSEYNKKVKSMHSLAPVAFMSNSESPFVAALSPFLGHPNALVELIGSTEFLPNSKMLNIAGEFLCKDTSLVQELCANVLFLICGYDHENLNRSMIPDIIASVPAGASVNQVLHFVQEYRSGKFRMFDYGILRNLIEYGSMKPPEYNLDKITTPVALYYGENDWLAATKDVQELASKLGNLQINYKIQYPNWNHLDYLWGVNAKNLLYDILLKNIENFN